MNPNKKPKWNDAPPAGKWITVDAATHTHVYEVAGRPHEIHTEVNDLDFVTDVIVAHYGGPIEIVWHPFWDVCADRFRPNLPISLCRDGDGNSVSIGDVSYDD